MKAIDRLRQEHRRIEQILTALECAASQIDAGGPVPPFIDDLLGFLQEFADIGHHAKEEAFLFPAMIRRGVGPDGMVNAMAHQHNMGRVHVRDMRKSLDQLRHRDASARAAFAGSAHAYVELLRVHIQIEDDELYPLAERLFSASEDSELVGHFAVVDGSPEAGQIQARWDSLFLRIREPAGQ
jgi:hemerythrin-like domain-containing protein